MIISSILSVPHCSNPIALDSILIILNIGAAILLWFLPETRGLALPQTSADLDVFQVRFLSRVRNSVSVGRSVRLSVGPSVGPSLITFLAFLSNSKVEKSERPTDGLTD